MEPSERGWMTFQSALAKGQEAFLPASFPQTGTVYTWEQAVRVLRKNSRFALCLAGILTLAIVGVAFALKDVYKPTARLEIDPLSSGIKTLHEIDDDETTDNQDYLETQAQILGSDALAINVIRTLHLDRNPEFVSKRELARSSNLEKPLAPADSGSASEAPYLQEQFALAERTPLEATALEVFQNKLSVSSVRNSRLIEVSFASHDPQLAQLVTNTLVTQFINQNYKNRYTSTMQASEWLSSQLSDLRQKVESANQAVSDYQKKYGFVEADDPDVPLTQLMSEVNHQLSDAQANRIETEAYARMIDLGQSDAVPALRDDQLYQSLMTHESDLRAQLAQARAVYGDENSNVKKLENASNELATQLEAERSRAISRVRTSLGALRAREQMMLDARDKLMHQMGDASSHVVAYRVLKNGAAADAELYNTLQARLKEAGIYAGLGSSNIHIVDLAPKLREASEPHRELIIAIGAMVSCILALVFAFVRESFDNTVRTPDDLREWVGLSSLAMIPASGNGTTAPRLASFPKFTLPTRHLATAPSVLLMRSDSEGGEAIHGLRMALAGSRPGKSLQVVLVSSPGGGEGKTTIAANLAAALAQQGKTCLIDGDLRRSMAGEAFGLRAGAGLGQYLAGSSPLRDVLKTLPNIPNLAVLPGGPLMPNPGDLIASERMRDTLLELRNQFEHIVIDSPPVIPFADARVLSLLSDAVVLVGRYGLTTRRAMARGFELLDEIHAPVVGAVVNDIDLGSADYRYYNYGFSRKTNGYRDYYAKQDLDGSSQPPQPDPLKKKSAHA